MADERKPASKGAMQPPHGQRQWRVRMLLLHGTLLLSPPALGIAHARFGLRAPGFCLVKSAVGVDCPACGITRSVMALLSGRIGEAFHIHPAGPIVFGIVAAVSLYLVAVLFGGWSGMPWRKEAGVYGLLEKAALSVLMLGWIDRLVVTF